MTVLRRCERDPYMFRVDKEPVHPRMEARGYLSKLPR